MPGTILIRTSVRGARAAGHRISSAGRAIQTILLDEFASLSRTSTSTTRQFAPHRTGRLRRSIEGRVRSYGGRITLSIAASARSDRGYDYLPVTRFGHREDKIYPKHGKALKFIPPTDVGGQGKPIYRAWVHGYHPQFDWVEQAYAALDREVRITEERVGRKIDSRLL